MTTTASHYCYYHHHYYNVVVLVLLAQEATAASYVATMKTIRQVKTVFVIFIAFVCCWSPYIAVLLYDSTDSLPLPVHLYASMLAHLHASLDFAIYSLMNPNLRSSFVSRLVACCHRLALQGHYASSPSLQILSIYIVTI